MRIQKQRRSPVDYAIHSLAIALVVGGLYLLYTAFSPVVHLHLSDPTNNATTKLLATTPEQHITENRLYIPKIDVNVPYAAGDATTLEHGAWWRQPSNGNPQAGGNFVLAAHRFIMGVTPEQTRRKSPFYNINLLRKGDEIIIDYEQKRYIYIITDITQVKPHAVEIEHRTAQPQLTLYSCTLGGANDGREVFVARPKTQGA